MQNDQGWTTRQELRTQLGISERTFHRRLKVGAIESTDSGGIRIYRLADRSATATAGHAANGSHNGQDAGHIGQTPADVPPNVLALVQRYEDRLDAVTAERAQLTAEHAELQRQLTTERVELNGLVAQLRAEVQTGDHRRQLVELEAKHNAERLQSAAAQFRAVAEQRRADAERAQREAESLRQRLEALQTLDDTPWWAFGRRRQLHAVLAGAVLTD